MLLNEKPICKAYSLHNSNYMAFQKSLNYGNSEQISGCQGWQGEMNGQSTTQWQTHVIMYLAKPIECTKPRVNPNVNCRLWVMIMCWYRFINCHKCTTLAGDIDVRGSYAWVEAGSTWEILVHFPLLCYELQSSSKNKAFVLKVLRAWQVEMWSNQLTG